MVVKNQSSTKKKRGGKKNILVVLWAAEESARDFYTGFAHQARLYKNWNVHLVYERFVNWPDIIQALREHLFDGLVVTDSTIAAHTELADFPDLTLVVFGPYQPQAFTPISRCAYLAIDNREIGEVAAHHFLKLGNFRTYGYIHPPQQGVWSDLRCSGFCNTLLSLGKDCRIFENTTPLRQWICTLPRPAALLASCDYVGLEVLAACRMSRLDVPKDISVLGVDNERFLCETATPPLSSVLPKHEAVGTEVARTLQALLVRSKRNAKCRRVCCGCTIFERETTAPVSPGVHLLQSGLEFIQKHASENISVGRVINHLGVSRRLAELRFREYQGESILQTIIRIRLEAVAKCLQTSNLPIIRIASDCGFEDPSYLARLFRRHFGISMKDFRSGHSIHQQSAITPLLFNRKNG